MKSSHYQFKFYPYQRYFRQPLKTSQGIWQIREGIILRLVDKNNDIGWGEIAPLPEFGSETFLEALSFCQQLDPEITQDIISLIPIQLPACQFGFESALENLSQVSLGTSLVINLTDFNCSYLLPSGEAALEECQKLDYSKYNTFKWKIGIQSISKEMELFEKLLKQLPTSAKLRLDANAGLSLEDAKKWLEVSEKTDKVEFLEQPLSPFYFDEMLALSQNYQTPLALDESVFNLEQLDAFYQKGWRGIFIIKAAMIGSPKRLRQFCQTHPIDAVFSSVFETKIGQQSALRLAKEMTNPARAIGFGVNHWFREEDKLWFENLLDKF